jgi:hypothetical protein
VIRMASQGATRRRIPAGDQPGADQAPDQAWRILELNRGWTSHADAKAGVALATAGVASGVLFSLVHIGTKSNGWISMAAIISAALLVASATCSAAALRPRRLHDGAHTSLIYFDHIAHSGLNSSLYVSNLRDLLSDQQRLTNEIGTQIWAVSKVAAIKYSWVDKALFLLLGAMAAVALTAVLTVVAVS